MYDNFDPTQISVALIAGGRSNERPISLKSAEGAKTALTQAGFKITQLDPAEKNDLKQLIDGEYDVAFLCLHGKGGEDGSIQGFLETIGIPYTGSGIWACSTSIDKNKAKQVYIKNNIPTPKALTADLSHSFDFDDILTELGQKCVVKAATEGSSIGVYIVEGKEALQQALTDCLKIDNLAVIERYIKGPEYTVTVLDTEEGPKALPIIEIIPQADSYDFDSKYQPGGSTHICPAELDAQTTAKMQAYAVKAHQSLGCSGVSRNDFIIGEDGNMWILETNTIPGMTETSLVPDAAKAAGIEFSELCSELVKQALKR